MYTEDKTFTLNNINDFIDTVDKYNNKNNSRLNNKSKIQQNLYLMIFENIYYKNDFNDKILFHFKLLNLFNYLEAAVEALASIICFLFSIGEIQLRTCIGMLLLLFK